VAPELRFRSVSPGTCSLDEARAQGAPRLLRTWPNRRLLDVLKIEHPIVQAPMGGHVTPDMPVAVSTAGGLGSFPSAGLTPAQMREEVGKIHAKSAKPINLNFFCHSIPQREEASESAWRRRLAPYYVELGVDPPASPARVLMPFGVEMCDTVIELKPDVVSFHFGLPERSLVDRIYDAFLSYGHEKDKPMGETEFDGALGLARPLAASQRPVR
jgi:NAD(P)H-dependent flavin oxidoreductase YrpB (nitropropane dioxygenase family)